MLAFMKALLLAKTDFVEMLCDFHFDLEKFLTVERLFQIYVDCVHTNRIADLIHNFLGNPEKLQKKYKRTIIDMFFKDVDGEYEIHGSTDRLDKLSEIDQIEFLKLLNDLERELIFPGTLSYKYISTCELIYDKID